MISLNFSDQCDVITYRYGQFIAVGISSKADHPLAGCAVTDIHDQEDLKGVLDYLSSSGLKVPLH